MSAASEGSRGKTIGSWLQVTKSGGKIVESTTRAKTSLFPPRAQPDPCTTPSERDRNRATSVRAGRSEPSELMQGSPRKRRSEGDAPRFHAPKISSGAEPKIGRYFAGSSSCENGLIRRTLATMAFFDAWSVALL